MEEVKKITKNGAKFLDGQEEKFDSIILATGYKSNVTSWLKVRQISFIHSFYLFVNTYKVLVSF